VREAQRESGTLINSAKWHTEAAVGKDVVKIQWETRNVAYPNFCDVFPGILIVLSLLT